MFLPTIHEIRIFLEFGLQTAELNTVKVGPGKCKIGNYHLKSSNIFIEGNSKIVDAPPIQKKAQSMFINLKTIKKTFYILIHFITFFVYQ